VVNAGCYEKDMVHIREVERQWKAEGRDVTVTDWSGRCLLALQGVPGVRRLGTLLYFYFYFFFLSFLLSLFLLFENLVFFFF
jgi:hypothetical protein